MTVRYVPPNEPAPKGWTARKCGTGSMLCVTVPSPDAWKDQRVQKALAGLWRALERHGKEAPK